MDEKTAWNCFEHTGNVMDYLKYSQCKLNNEEYQMREEPDADRDRRLGYSGEERG